MLILCYVLHYIVNIYNLYIYDMLQSAFIKDNCTCLGSLNFKTLATVNINTTIWNVCHALLLLNTAVCIARHVHGAAIDILL